jgi:tetratricopeptide (TPR) repeat protein
MKHRNHLATAARSSVLAVALAVAATAPAAAREPAVDAVRIALQTPKAEAAVAAAERAVAAHPKVAEAWYYAGQAYGKMAMQASMLGKPGWAGKTRDAFQKAAQLDPDHLGAREGLVQFYSIAPGFMGGGDDKAAAEIDAFAKRNPAGGHYLRGAMAKGEVAERELRAAVKLAPDDARYRRALISLLEKNKRTPEAIQLLDAGLVRSPDEPRLLYMLGRHAAVHGERVDEGLAALDRLIARASTLPDDVPLGGAHWRRGQLREKRGQKADALSDYRRAMAVSPGLDDAKKDASRLAAAMK